VTGRSRDSLRRGALNRAYKKFEWCGQRAPLPMFFEMARRESGRGNGEARLKECDRMQDAIPLTAAPSTSSGSAPLPRKRGRGKGAEHCSRGSSPPRSGGEVDRAKPETVRGSPLCKKAGRRELRGKTPRLGEDDAL